jgi:hypothetical protein
MPASKIAKIVGRLLALLDATKVTLRQLRETMGLLRYLGTCIPVAKPFYIRLQAFMCDLEKVSVPLRLQLNQVEAVRWLLARYSPTGCPFATYRIRCIARYVYGTTSRSYPSA